MYYILYCCNKARKKEMLRKSLKKFTVFVEKKSTPLNRPVFQESTNCTSNTQ